MSKVYEARKKKAAERKIQKAKELVESSKAVSAPVPISTPEKSNLEKQFQKVEEKCDDEEDDDGDDGEEETLFYEPPPEEIERKQQKKAEKEQQKKMLAEMYEMMMTLHKEKTSKKSGKASSVSMQFKEEINRTPSVHPVRSLFNLP